MRYLLPLILSLLVATAARAQDGVATFAYQTGTIYIVRATLPPPPQLPWKPVAPMPLSQAAVEIQVAIRPGSSMYNQEGWINTGSLAGRNGIFFVFDKPQQVGLKRLEYYQPIDVLWVDNNGVITSIAPGISLPDLKKPLSDPTPSKALLLLAGGTAEMESINPGDKLVGSDYFQVLPKVMTIQ